MVKASVHKIPFQLSNRKCLKKPSSQLALSILKNKVFHLQGDTSLHLSSPRGRAPGLGGQVSPFTATEQCHELDPEIPEGL